MSVPAFGYRLFLQVRVWDLDGTAGSFLTRGRDILPEHEFLDLPGMQPEVAAAVQTVGHAIFCCPEPVGLVVILGA